MLLSVKEGYDDVGSCTYNIYSLCEKAEIKNICSFCFDTVWMLPTVKRIYEGERKAKGENEITD